ncbi:MAG: hypothetical protein AB1796_05095 [Bacillota bacterium]
MVKVVNHPAEQIKARMARRGFNLEESQALLKSKKGDVILPKKRSCRQSNLKDKLNRFC